MSMKEADIVKSPEYGCYISGLFLEGARWSRQVGPRPPLSLDCHWTLWSRTRTREPLQQQVVDRGKPVGYVACTCSPTVHALTLLVEECTKSLSYEVITPVALATPASPRPEPTTYAPLPTPSSAGHGAGGIQAEGAVLGDASGLADPHAEPRAAPDETVLLPALQDTATGGCAVHHRPLHQLHHVRGAALRDAGEALDRAGGGALHLAQVAAA
eukprot:517200-Prorocentrum_minimum.AAC.2